MIVYILYMEKKQLFRSCKIRGMSKFIIVSAPSGAGKTTIVHEIMKTIPELEFSISATSRAPRENEKDGVDYNFLCVDGFKSAIANNELLEWEEVYPNQFYGTLNAQVDTAKEAGKVLVFDVDVDGGVTLKNKFGADALALFVTPPSIQELKHRLIRRGTETQGTLHIRLGRAQKEMNRAGEFDHQVVNTILEDAVAETEKLVKEYISK